MSLALKVSAEAEACKEEGNRAFAREKWAAAIDAYTNAITAAPAWVVPYVNRALAHKRRADWRAMLEDAHTALRLDDGNVKARWLLGLGQLETGDAAAAARTLHKALEAAREAGAAVQDDIWRTLARAKFQVWQLQSGQRRAQAAAREALLQRLLSLVDAGALADAPAPTAEAATAGDMCESGGPGAGGGDDAALAVVPATAPPPSDRELLQAVFDAARGGDARCEPPDELVCPLTLDIFRDPVVAPSGRSYERSAVLEHLQRNGQFDPVTRAPLKPSELYRNVGLRVAAHSWLDAHPWAWGELAGEAMDAG